MSRRFPKVILETAASSIPSLVYDSYGMGDIITNNENGFIINNKKQANLKIEELINSPLLLEKNSQGAFLLSKNFDWKLRIKDWESVIEKLL